MSAPLTILHVLAPAESGGLESVVRLLASGHAARGHLVHVAAVVDGPNSAANFTSTLERSGVRVSTIVIPSRAYLRERSAIAELCNKIVPDIVHTHGYRVDLLDAGVARTAGIPTTTTVHGYTGGDWKNRLYEMLQRRAFRSFEAVVVVSKPLESVLLASGVRGDRLHLIPNAYASLAPHADRARARAELGVSDERFLAGFVGRLSEEKGADILIEALGHLGKSAPSLVVLGDGPEANALRALTVARGIGDRVIWRGVVPEADRFFTAFDVFVLSSRTEGTPIALFEAMAAGSPIVATRVGGVPDVLTSSEALLVDAEDSRALAAAIASIMRDPASAARRAAEARNRLSREFALEPWLDRYEALYRGIHRVAPPPT